MASLSNGGGQQKSPSSGERQQQERLVYSTRRIITTSTRREITKSQSSKELLEEKSSLRPQQKQEGLVSDSSTTLSAGRVDDSICVLEQQQQWQQRQPTGAIMSPAKRAYKQAKLASHNEPLEQQERQQVKQSQSQFENNNHNNGNNDCNNGKVRLLISPATDYYGSKQLRQQQQMVHSTMIGDDEAILQQQQQQQQQQPQQQQPRTRSHAGRQFRQQKNYHHYDYYTDSDLASTTAANQSQQQYAAYLNQTKPMVNHYDDNILLFATEHNNTKPPPANVGHQQQVYLATNDGSRSSRSSRSNQNQANNNNQNYYYLHQLPEVAANRAQLNLNKAGRFVNYYPSWRQTQSPTTSHSYQNYSFHVPTSPSTARLAAAYRGRQHQRPDSRAGRSFNSSLRSQTIAHIPNMVRQLANNSSDNNGKARVGNGDQTGDEQTNSSPIAYEDFYERPSQVGISLTDQRSRGISEGDLLKVHLVHLNHDHRPSYHHVDEGFDNPFKPGTELSWEADMMVRLMKRGYPVQELPVLVETAKQVAREKSSPTAAAAAAAPVMVTNTNSLASKHGGHSTVKDDFEGSSRVREVEGLHPFSSKQTQALIRRKSSADLSPGKQIWANSLIRAKSMPRFYARPQAATSSADSDSIDKLITSIENEMTDLLRFEQEEDIREDEETKTTKRLKSASMSRIEGQNSNSKAQTKRVQKGAKTISKVPTTKTANSNNKSKKLESPKRGFKVSTESDDNNQRVLQEVTNRKRLATSGGQNPPAVVKKKEEEEKKNKKKKKAQDLKEVEKKRETACCVIQ